MYQVDEEDSRQRVDLQFLASLGAKLTRRRRCILAKTAKPGGSWLRLPKLEGRERHGELDLAVCSRKAASLARLLRPSSLQVGVRETA